MINLLEYDQIGRVILIAIPAATAILLPIYIGHIIYSKFIIYLQGLIDRLENLLVTLATGNEPAEIDDD